MNYQETLDYMFTQLPMYQRTGKAAYKANLDTTLALDNYFNHPHTKFKTVHVAGTNGKGSVSHSVASVLQESGLKVGLYTSPHLRDFRERIKINGELITEDAVIDFIENNKEKFEELHPSFFEMTVAMAFDYFEKEKVDIAVIEVGLGGRLDSTNIIAPLLSVITNISKDHTAFLGTELVDIAREKAGIIKKDIPVIVGKKQPEIADLFCAIADERDTELYFAEDIYTLVSANSQKEIQKLNYMSGLNDNQIELSCDLLGQYQQDNIRTAICTCDELVKLGIEIRQSDLKKGLENIVKNTGLLGRWQILQNNPKVICDTGHNVAGIREILEQIERTEYRKLSFVFGMVDDKNIEEVLSLMPKEATYYFTKASIPRALDENVLKEQAKKFGLVGNAYALVSEALENAIANSSDEDLIFVGGSTFVVAEVV
ncbi:bifunctional folylpolyglutamate synthase/dihydrofolate synthase [Marinifilum sp. N1E240]|uniref:bifunctional folylpolyglutamate synthase/dihydrofolate synthase n=1 Tax=Marinifilum sp. N1E240 TaxID=2608082 RepID=UPI00128DC09B|nr:folylpolyglutamate synthase/dihydrofolate synthase family protein [Marinifilum sp. N1E240]MPQ45956.1 bifunctional folylpolyglutamate synthase/dihydrofolate synthase [Marinifilum sp. N1E240]